MGPAERPAPDRVSVSVEDGIAEARLARSGRHNALDLPMFSAIVAAQERLGKLDSVRVVVLSGDGPSFCSGLDLKAFAAAGSVPEELLDRPAGQVANLAQRAAYGWRVLPVPVIAAIHGACFGGGLQIALGADIRIAAPSARLSVMEITLGLVPDMAISQTLPGLVRDDWARELVMSGREVGGAEALELGLVSRLAEDPRAAARELAREIAASQPRALRAAKSLFNGAFGAPPERALQVETKLVKSLLPNLGTPKDDDA